MAQFNETEEQREVRLLKFRQVIQGEQLRKMCELQRIQLNGVSEEFQGSRTSETPEGRNTRLQQLKGAY